MTEENLNQKILSWLNTQGYGVEMQVAKSLSASGFEILQLFLLTMYPEKGISRQIDVIGRTTDVIGSSVCLCCN